MQTLRLNNLMAIMALGTLMFLRFVDVSVFEAKHGHVMNPHVQELVTELTHGHDETEYNEHETLDAKSAHAGFHALLNVFIEAEDIHVPVLQNLHASYGFHAKDLAKSFGYRPPTPPPLA